MTTQRSQAHFALLTPLTPMKTGRDDRAPEHDVPLREQIAVMQQTIDDLLSKNASLEEELNSMKVTMKHITGNVEPYCHALEAKFAEWTKKYDSHVQLKNKELNDKVEALKAEVQKQMQRVEDKLTELATAVAKDVDLFIDVADLKSTMREQELGQAILKNDMFEAMETMKELKQVSTSYKDALKAGLTAPTSSSVPLALASSANVPATRCIVKTPRGYFKGKGARQLAQDYNIKVVSKLTLIQGHVTLPEATGVVLLEPREGAPFDLWLVYFSTANDVTKMFAYKPQLKDVCPTVFIQPDLPKEVRMKRKLLVLGAKQFVQNQGSPTAWHFKWVENMKIMISGPAGAKRFVVMEGEAARVVMEGKVKVNTEKRGGGVKDASVQQ